MKNHNILINYDGTIALAHIDRPTITMFLGGDLSWAELAEVATTVEMRSNQAMIVSSPDELREATQDTDFEAPVTQIVYIGKLPIAGRPTTSVFVLDLDKISFDDIRVGTDLDLLVCAGRFKVTDIADNGKIPMFDRDAPSDEIRAQFRASGLAGKRLAGKKLSEQPGAR